MIDHRVSLLLLTIWALVESFSTQHIRINNQRSVAATFLVHSASSGDDNDNINENDGGDKISSDGDAKIREMTKSLFGKDIPSNPFEASFNRPSKADIYGNEELQVLWELHNDISQLPKQETNSDIDESNVLGLHEMILDTMGTESNLSDTAAALPEEPSNDWLSDDFKKRISKIRVIASDVDGTLLTNEQTIHPRTKQAIQRAVSMAFSPLDKFQMFFPATGKSRKGALSSLGKEIGGLLSQTPGVFLQGLYCVDANGEIIFQKKLNTLAVEAAEELAKSTGVSILAYDGDDLLTTELTEPVLRLHSMYGEPMPQVLEDGKAIAEHGPSVHKLILTDDDTERLNTVVRPQLEKLAVEYDATVTQAMPTMLELLPWGCSKALGVQKVCEALNIDLGTEVLAMGDAENDCQLLEKASIGVAMGNASPVAQESADFVMTETNNEGGAGAAIEVFAFGQVS